MSEPKKASRGTKRVMDVSHPGKSAPSASSRPVIVTNRPILKDPMMREEASAPVLPEAPTTPVSREVEVTPASEEAMHTEEKPKESEKTIAQLAEEAKARVDKAKADKAAEEESSKEEPTPEPEVSEEKPKEDDDATETEMKSSDTSTPGAEAAADEEAKLAEEAKHDEELEKLVETKEYFLPINAVEKRRTKRVVALGILLSIVLAIAWVDIALDAGIIQTNEVKPITHFFSN